MRRAVYKYTYSKRSKQAVVVWLNAISTNTCKKMTEAYCGEQITAFSLKTISVTRRSFGFVNQDKDVWGETWSYLIYLVFGNFV